MAQVEILAEREGPRGWVFDAQVLDDLGTLRRHQLSLSWSDYDLWCRGGDQPPQRVAEAVLLFLAGRLGARELREGFDASIVRRHFPDADRTIPEMIGR